MSGVKEMKEVELAMPNEIELDEMEITYLTSLFEDLQVFMKRNNDINQQYQQIQAAAQQNQSEMMGTGKAIEKIIKEAVKHKGFIGHYTYNTDKKILELRKEVPTQ